jgi:cysteine desulfurase
VAASHVLEAMKVGDLAHQTIRVSSGWTSTEDDFNRFAEIWLQVYKN